MCTGLEIAALAATAVSAVGAVSQGMAGAAAAKSQSKMYRQQAEYQRALSARDEEDYRRRQAAMMATRRAMMGGSGTVGGTGSSLLVDQDIAGEVEYQALRIRSGGEAEAIRYENQAAFLKSAASQSKLSGFARGGALLIGGASNVSWGGGTDPYATAPAGLTGYDGRLAGPV